MGEVVGATSSGLWCRCRQTKVPLDGTLRDQLRRFREVLDSLVTERLMRLFKQCTKTLPSSPVWERTAVVAIYSAQLASTVVSDKLLGDDEFELACTSLGRRIAKDTFVGHRKTNVVGRVLTCRQMDAVALIVSEWRTAAIPNTQRSAYWSFVALPAGHAVRQWHAHSCEVALGWKRITGGTIVLPAT